MDASSAAAVCLLSESLLDAPFSCCLGRLTFSSHSAPGQTYTISTFAGGALPVIIPGASATLDFNSPEFVAADRAGNLFFVVWNQSVVLRWDATTTLFTRVAGNGTTGFSGDDGPATSAQLYLPTAVAVDSAGNLYIADTANYMITTIAGDGAQGNSGGPRRHNHRRCHLEYSHDCFAVMALLREQSVGCAVLVLESLTILSDIWVFCTARRVSRQRAIDLLAGAMLSRRQVDVTPRPLILAYQSMTL